MGEEIVDLVTESTSIRWSSQVLSVSNDDVSGPDVDPTVGIPVSFVESLEISRRRTLGNAGASA